MRFRRARRMGLEPRMFGIGYDSGFYDGGQWLFVQFGFRCYGIWWGDDK